uniref:Uncharacterized protein n=1 Tax=Arundo donax TaxID=35708 RepID=A0A0A9E7V0_ARUDO
MPPFFLFFTLPVPLPPPPSPPALQPPNCGRRRGRRGRRCRARSKAATRPTRGI